jgi:hypothetical protein
MDTRAMSSIAVSAVRTTGAPPVVSLVGRQNARTTSEPRRSLRQAQ